MRALGISDFPEEINKGVKHSPTKFSGYCEAVHKYTCMLDRIQILSSGQLYIPLYCLNCNASLGINFFGQFQKRGVGLFIGLAP